jgi:hypothetical protein
MNLIAEPMMTRDGKAITVGGTYFVIASRYGEETIQRVKCVQSRPLSRTWVAQSVRDGTETKCVVKAAGSDGYPLVASKRRVLLEVKAERMKQDIERKEKSVESHRKYLADSIKQHKDAVAAHRKALKVAAACRD